MFGSAEVLPPMVAEIAAPAATVYGLLSLDLPNAMVRPMPDASTEGRLARVGAEAGGHWRSVEVVIPAPPDTVTYRMISGPCSRLERRFHILSRNGHSRLLVEGHWVPGGVFNRLGGQKQVAQATRSLLAMVQQQAEEIARGDDMGQGAPLWRSPSRGGESLSVLRRRLHTAIEQQELIEWGLGGHAAGVARLTADLAAALQLAPELCRAIVVAATLHDLGKTRLEARLFDRSTTLTATGQSSIEQHAALGAELVAALPDSEILIPAIRHHHERWDGTGYPDRLAGTAIPLPARILSVAEAADAMQRRVGGRPERSARDTATILERHAGSQWDREIAYRMAAILMRAE